MGPAAAGGRSAPASVARSVDARPRSRLTIRRSRERTSRSSFQRAVTSPTNARSEAGTTARISPPRRPSHSTVVIGHAGRQCRLRRPSGRPARAEPDEQAAAGGQDALDLGGDVRVRRHPLGPGLVDRRDEIDAAVGHRPWRPAGLVGHDHQAVPRDLGQRGRRGVGRPAEREDRPQVASRQRIAPDGSAGRVAGVLVPDRGPAARRPGPRACRTPVQRADRRQPSARPACFSSMTSW